MALLLCIGAAVLSLVLGNELHLPGVFWAKAAIENGMPAIEFRPNFTGITLIAALSSIVNAAVSVRSLRTVAGKTGRA